MASFGETLKQARAHKGVTLKEAEQATRINRNHLAALEDEDFGALPPLIYQRGIVRNYAMYLELDPARTLSLFEDARGIDDSVTMTGVEAVPPVNMPSHWAPNFAVIAFAVVLSAIVFAWGYSALVQPSSDESAPTEIVATVTPFASDVSLPTPTPVTPTPEPTPEPEPTEPPVERVDNGRTDAPAGDDGGDNQLAQQRNNGSEGDQSGQSDSMLNEDAATSLDLDAASEAIEQVTSNEPEPGVHVTSIAVSALDQPITISMVADGVPVYEGRLEPGQSTDFFDGSVFEVFTSSGANTLFTNSCDLPFNMGYEPGEAFYILNADEDSCAPIGG